MIKLTETTYHALKDASAENDVDDIIIQRPPRYVRPFTNDEDEESDMGPEDIYIPNVLVDEIPEEDKSESDPDDPCMTLKEINSRRHRYNNP